MHANSIAHAHQIGDMIASLLPLAVITIIGLALFVRVLRFAAEDSLRSMQSTSMPGTPSGFATNAGSGHGNGMAAGTGGGIGAGLSMASSSDPFGKDDDDWLSDSPTQGLSGTGTGMDPFGNGLPVINPATGLPMIDGFGGVDVGGNLYGSSASDDFLSSSTDIFSDPFSSDGSCGLSDSFGGSSFGTDSFGSGGSSGIGSDSFGSGGCGGIGGIGSDWP